MSTAVQFDFFKETTEEDVLKAEISALKESHHSVRKKMFCQMGLLTRMLLDQKNEIDSLKHRLGIS